MILDTLYKQSMLTRVELKRSPAANNYRSDGRDGPI